MMVHSFIIFANRCSSALHTIQIERGGGGGESSVACSLIALAMLLLFLFIQASVEDRAF